MYVCVYMVCVYGVCTYLCMYACMYVSTPDILMRTHIITIIMHVEFYLFNYVQISINIM